MIITVFEITDSEKRTWYFEKTFLIADILTTLVSGTLFLKLRNPYFSWTARIIQ